MATHFLIHDISFGFCVSCLRSRGVKSEAGSLGAQAAGETKVLISTAAAAAADHNLAILLR
jgi:hypothetical protein